MYFVDSATSQNENQYSLFQLIKELKNKNIPENQYIQYVERFLEFKARKKRVPVSGTFELTPLCNFDCKMCYIHLDKKQFSKQLLAVESWKRIIIEAQKAGMLKASLTGGECLTYPGFDDIYFFLRERGIRCAILSNGYFMDETRVDFLRKNPPALIQITLYGGSEEVYEKVTGKRAFQRVYRNICMLRDAGLNVTIGITPNEFMYDDRYKVIDAAQSTGVPYHINAALITPRAETGREKKDITVEHYIEMVNYSNQLKHVESRPVDLTELPEENSSGSKRYGLQCGGARSGFTIRYDGTMSPCAALDSITSNPLEVGFKNAWEDIVKQADRYPLPEECSGCAYEFSCFHCVAMHKDAPVFGHCNPQICERTKKMISSGIISLSHKR